MKRKFFNVLQNALAYHYKITHKKMQALPYRIASGISYHIADDNMTIIFRSLWFENIKNHRYQ